MTSEEKILIKQRQAEGIKVKTVVIPDNRKTINEFFSKFDPYSIEYHL